MSIKGNITGAATSVLVGIGQDMLKAFAPELYPAFNEWLAQRKTPDGWTEAEYLAYAYGAIGRIKAKTIGPAWVDHVGDWGLQALMMKIASRLDEIEQGVTPELPADPPPADVPPVDETPAPGQFGVMYAVKPKASDYHLSCILYTNNSPVPAARRWVVLTTSEKPWAGWSVDTW